MAEEYHLEQVSAIREKLQDLPPFLTKEQHDELLGTILTVPVVTSDLSVTVAKFSGETTTYTVPAFTSIDTLRKMISEEEGIPLGQIKLCPTSKNKVVSNNTVMGSLVTDTMNMHQPTPSTPSTVDTDALGDEISNMPAFGLDHRQVSNESQVSNFSNFSTCSSTVELSMVRQARMSITKTGSNADLSNDGQDVSLHGPCIALLEDCGPGSKVMARLLGRGSGLSYIGVCNEGVDLDQEPHMAGAFFVSSSDVRATLSWSRDGNTHDLQCPRFVCGDILMVDFSHDGRSFKLSKDGERIGRFSIDESAYGERNSEGMVVALGGQCGTKWQVLDSATPEMWLAPKGLPLISHWDMTTCNVISGFKRANFLDDIRGTVMLKGCGRGSTVIARALQKGAGPLYIGVCESTFGLSHMPIIPGAHSLFDNGHLYADGNQIGNAFGGFRTGDILTLTVNADGTAFALAKNGVGQVIVNNIPANTERVICMGGVGPCVWELA